MCGITGISLQNNTIDITRFMVMRDTLAHRGPDNAGNWIHTNKKIGFGHRRLAFMDLSPQGSQPMKSHDGKIIISVNGEIYNYQKLKFELENAGHIFQTKSDSEVIIHAWREWKTDMPQKLNGMFALALFDETTHEIFLARDRFGIKPLYYHHSNTKFAFASEIKAIISYFPELQKIRKASVADYFSYRYIPSPFSIYESIFKLEPGSYLLLNHNNQIQIKKYFQPKCSNTNLSQNEINEELKFLFRRSVKMHTQSHVPVGAFLSGGYDSSAIVQQLSEINYKANTFSIGFSNWDHSEDKYAKIVAQKFEMPHFSYQANQSDLDLLPKLMHHYDEPIADISIIPTYLVSKLAQNKNKAVLSGEGADELFSGYTWHYENIKNNRFLYQLKNTILKTNKAKAFSVEAYSRAMSMGHFRHQEICNLLTPKYTNEIPINSDWFYQNSAIDSGLNRFRLMDMRCFMSELVLTKIDRASMANSLEVRVPFLENDLVDFMLSIHPGKLHKKGYNKYQLHEIIKESMPTEILQRKKQGFVGPDTYYENSNWYREIIEDANTIKDGIINKDELKRFHNEHSYWKLWKFAVFEKWYSTWFS